jgi:hypothetical protein
MEAVLHPIRHAFHLHLAEKLVKLPAMVTEPIVKMMTDGIVETTRAISSASEPIILQKEIPIFSAYLATRGVAPQHFLEAALHLREEGPFSEARKQLVELEQILSKREHGSFVQQVNQLQRNIRKTSEELLAKYHVTTPQGISSAAVTSILNIPLKAKTGFGLPSFGGRLPFPAVWNRLRDAYGFRAVFRSVTTELVSVARLGKLYDIISSAVVRSEHARRYSGLDAERYSDEGPITVP